MARARPRSEIGFGSDSFLDVVANVVGILIILVIAVGIRARHAPPAAASASPPPAALGDLQQQLAQESQAADAAAAQSRHLAGRLVQLQASERELALLVRTRTTDRDVRSTARELAAGESAELARQVAVAQAYLDRVESELATARAEQPEVVEIESLPTPISRTVETHETHVQLAAGRVVRIPLDELLERLRRDAVQQLATLRELPEFNDVVGPIGGFRLRYTMRRVDLKLEARRGEPARRGSYAQLAEWTLVPSGALLGEPLDRALEDGSQFRQALARLDPPNETITVWVYPDSFTEFRTLREALYREGFTVAARPLPQGRPISGSPEGTKSAAQ
jgi:hypothetical protein